MNEDRAYIADLKKQLKMNLSERRYEHTLGVAYTSACLAMRYGADPFRAEVAGLLHDCAKEFPDTELIRLLDEAGMPPTEDERRAPQVLHAVYGPLLAEKRYGVTDPEILSAIRWHTTGKADMTLLEKIVFTADYMEPNRDRAKDLPEVRPLAFRDIDRCILRITEDTLAYLNAKNAFIDPKTEECFLYFRKMFRLGIPGTYGKI